MKSFACGDIVPGCVTNQERETDKKILRNVTAHASAVHEVRDIAPELVSTVRAKIEPRG